MMKLADHRAWLGKGCCCDPLMCSWFKCTRKYCVVRCSREGEEPVQWLQGVMAAAWKKDVVRRGSAEWHALLCGLCESKETSSSSLFSSIFFLFHDFMSSTAILPSQFCFPPNHSHIAYVQLNDLFKKFSQTLLGPNGGQDVSNNLRCVYFCVNAHACTVCHSLFYVIIYIYVDPK